MKYTKQTLYQAAIKGNMNLMIKSINDGADAYAEDCKFLKIAARYGHAMFIDKVLTKYMYQIPFEILRQLFYIAVKARQWSVVKTMIKHGVSSCAYDLVLYRTLVDDDNKKELDNFATNDYDLQNTYFDIIGYAENNSREEMANMLRQLIPPTFLDAEDDDEISECSYDGYEEY